MSLKKRRILETATGLFSEEGYSSVGINRIIAESNTAKMTFYYHFPSKEFLIESVLLNHDENLRTSINKAIEKHQHPIDKIKSIFDWYKEWLASAEFHGCVFIKASQEFSTGSSRIREICQCHIAWLESTFSDLLKHLKVKTCVEMAEYIVAALNGLTVRANMFKGNNESLIISSWVYVRYLIRAESKVTIA